jgi:hypothetical protein
MVDDDVQAGGPVDGHVYVACNGEAYDSAWPVGVFPTFAEAKAAFGPDRTWAYRPAEDEAVPPYRPYRGSNVGRWWSDLDGLDYSVIFLVPVGALTPGAVQ